MSKSRMMDTRPSRSRDCRQPNYVLLDLGLPRLDGYQVAAKLREELAGPLVIVAITGFGQEADARKSLAAGCDYHFLKPVDLDALLAPISTPNSERHCLIDDRPSSGAMSPEQNSVLTASRQAEITNDMGLHFLPPR